MLGSWWICNCTTSYVSGWWFQPLWKILVKWDYCSQYMEKYKMFQTTNQILYPGWDISQVSGKTWHSTCPASATAGKQQSSQAFVAAVELFNGRFMGTWWTNFISLDWFSRENLQETMVFTLKYQWIFHWDYHQWIGFHGKILTGNHGKITIKYRAFRLKFSHHPILWSYW